MAASNRRSTQADVARAAGVSVATVSYVASGRRDRKIAATPEITRRVLTVMRQLDYRPARSGRVLARNRTDLVAVAVAAPFNPWSLELITQIEEVAARRGLGVIIQRYGHTADALDRVESQLVDGIADAAVVLGSGDIATSRLRRIGARVPLLVVGESYRPRGYDVMIQREHDAVRQAAEHLVGLGVRRPAFIAGQSVHATRRRHDAFVEVFREHGYPEPAVEVVDHDPDVFSGFLDARHLATELLDRPRDRRPDAIMANSDRAAIATLFAALQLGIKIPDELRIIGSGNIPEASRLTPGLTTVGVETEAYRPVIDRLLDRIKNPTTARTLVVPWRLIVRDTA